ncbi:MAG: DUF5683 domain-containing protein [Rikenellaceae bacterium]
MNKNFIKKDTFFSAYKQLFYTLLLLCITTFYAENLFSQNKKVAQAVTIVESAENSGDTINNATKVDSIKIDTTKIDTLKSKISNIDSVKIDSVQIDSLNGEPKKFVADSLKNIRLDTILISGGVMPIIKERSLDEFFVPKVDTIEEKKVEIRRPFSELAMQRSPIFEKDTIAVKRLTMLSMVAPGLGQLYNNQYIKIPILYATVGSFATLGAIASGKHKDAKAAYEEAVYSGADDDVVTALTLEKDRYNTQKTVYIAGAALSYMYFLSDGIVNYKGDIHPTRKATLLSALFPGAGQLYNGKYWKLPIVYGGFVTFGYVINFNNRGYQRYKLAYDLLADGDDSTVDEFGGYYSETVLKNTRDSFRRYRDLGIIMTVGFYVLQIVDAHVDAYLNRYDISDDLAINIEPTTIEPMKMGRGGSASGSSGYGIGLKIKF